MPARVPRSRVDRVAPRRPAGVGVGLRGRLRRGQGGRSRRAVPAEVDARLHSWRHPTIMTAALLSLASGYAQFAATATLPDVADAFGQQTGGKSLAARAGISLTTLGIGLAVMRLASLGALPLSGLADRLGRRRVIIGCASVGLALTALAAGSPAFWVFVLVLAVARPTMSATNAIAGVLAAEETRSVDRARAIALVTAGYALGAGLVAVLRAQLGDLLGFRGLFLLAVVPLALMPLAGRWLEEPARFARTVGARMRPRLTRLRRARLEVRRRVALVALPFFAISLVTGPANTFLFLYGENVLGMARTTTTIAVVSSGPLGLVGLLVGRAAADRVGRLPTAATAHVLVCLAALVTYSGRPWGVIVGYLTTIGAGGALAPAFGAVSTELFPTSVRGTVAGVIAAAGVMGATLGLGLYGVLLTVTGSFLTATVAVALPAAASAAVFLRLPETVGLELEESAPE